MKKIAKSVAKQTAGLAKGIAKQAAQDIGEIPKEVGREAVGVKTTQPSTRVSPIVEVMQKRDGKIPDVSKEEEIKITVKGLKQVEKLEAEMDKYRKVRTKQVVEPQPLLTEEKLSEPGKPILPPGRPSRGAAARSPAAKKERKVEAPLGKN